MRGEEERVWLSSLKFAKPTTNSQPSAATNHSPAQPNPSQNQTAFNTTSSGLGRAKLYETLSTETMAEDLAPDAGIWQQYLEEAKEHDGELVKGQNDNLDMMLLFAALFSAILSAFLIESKNMLQQDPADVSIALLLSIAQSQQRIEHGAPQLGSAPIELPSFSAPLSARWINGLWFFALALSLSAALIAMLAKEWLTAFTASRPRTAHAYTLLHQARLIGLTDWHALNIIDLLPSMLHLALLLFSLGLVIYLWTLDSGIAAVVAGVAGVTMVFYAATAFAAAIYESCPFVTQISKYIHRALRRYATEWMKQREQGPRRPNEHTTDEEQRALIWLIDKSRDIDAADYAYMCLTGLRLRTSTATTRSTDEENESFRPVSAPGGLGAAFSWIMRMIPGGKGPKQPDSQVTPLNGLFNRLCDHLSQVLVQQPRELAACQGLTVARYACALPKMVECLQLNYNHQTVGKGTNNEYEGMIAHHPAIISFAALDTIWSDDCPAMSADSYTLLTSAELRLIVGAMSAQCIAPSTRSPKVLPPTDTSYRNSSSTTESFIEITMDPTREASSGYPLSLFNLRARYARGLSRATYLLRYHGDRDVSINTDALIRLLDSVRAAGQCNQLNTESQMSTGYPHSGSGRCPDVYVRVVPFYNRFYLKPALVGDFDGLLVGLLRLLDPAAVQTSPALERAITGAKGVVAPTLLKQWLKVTLPHEGRNESKHAELSDEFLANWPLVEDSDSVDQVKAVLTQLVMRIAVFAASHSGCYGIEALPKEAVLALHRRFQATPGHLAQAFKYHYSDDIDRLICSIDFNSETLRSDVLKSLIGIFLLKHGDQTLFQSPGIAAASIVPFLRILDQVPCEAPERQTLLDALANFSQTDRSRLRPLTGLEAYFSELLEIGKCDEYRSIVAKCISRIIETATSLPWSSTLEEQGVLGACDAVAFALGALASDEASRANLLASTHELLTSLPSSSLREITTSPAARKLRHSLQDMRVSFEQQWHWRLEQEDILSWWLDGLPVEGLGPFFDHSEEPWVLSYHGWGVY